MPSQPASPGLRIGELSRRLGLSEHVLRAWERRYGVLQPARSPGGYRIYSAADESRVRRMQAHLARGVSAAEAARAALGEEAGPSGPGPGGPGGGGPAAGRRAGSESMAAAALALRSSLDAFDEPAAQAVLDQLFARYTVEAVLREVILPYLRELGERWQQGEVTIADEHLASNLLRGRLSALAQGWGQGIGPRAVLACAPGEYHDLGLLAFGIVLHRHGWRVQYLGADTPVDDVARTAAAMSADLAVVTAARPGHLDALTGHLARLASIVPLAIAGAAATQALADATHARLLARDPVTEAELMPAPGR